MQLLSSRRKAPKRKWIRLTIVVAVVVLLGGLYEGAKLLMPRYHRWKQAKALKEAKAFLEDHDAQNAQLALEVALKEVPGNPDALRLAANMLEQVGSPQAMKLRRAVVWMDPTSAEDTAKLVLCCLRFQDYNAARDALASASPQVSRETPMVRAALAFALATKESAVADALLTELKSRFPSDVELQHVHALLLLQHPNDERRRQAVAELEELSRTQPAMRLQIERELAGYFIQHKDFERAKHLYAEVVADPGAVFSDRLQQANIALLFDKQPFETVYAGLQAEAAQSEENAVQFVQWLMVQDRATQADTWLAALPAAVKSSRGVVTVEADLALQLKWWDRLQTLLQAGAWGPVQPEALRLAMAARTVDNPSHLSVRREVWGMALDAAGSNLPSLRMLQRLAQAWRWDDDVERTLWKIGLAYPDQTWAFQALFDRYREKEKTGSMRDVMEALLNTDGTVPRYRHDWALLSLLVSSSPTWDAPKEMLKRLYESDPRNPSYITSYAFALAQAGKGPEALAIANQLSPGDRDFPPRQPYLAYVYGVARRPEDFARAKSLGQGISLLPEEKFLFNSGEAALTRKVEKPKPAPKPGEAPTTLEKASEKADEAEAAPAAASPNPAP